MSALPHFTSTTHHKPYASINPTRPELSAKGKVIVITGGGSGIGKATCHAFGTAGAEHLVILDRDAKALSKVKAELIRSFSTSIHTFAVDITDAKSIQETLTHISSIVGAIDVLVNNAAYLPPRSSIVNSSPKEWWLGVDVNVRGPYNVTRSFLPHAKENAVVVNVSSCLAHMADTGNGDLLGQSSYSASKIASARMMEVLQEERKDLKIVNIHPGLVPTKMAASSGNLEISTDSDTLPAGFIVWLTTSEADFLKGRMVWANWDVDELIARKDEIILDNLLTLHLKGT